MNKEYYEWMEAEERAMKEPGYWKDKFLTMYFSLLLIGALFLIGYGIVEGVKAVLQ